MVSWLSTFLLNPALALGAGAVAGPILIHLLSKRRVRRVRWAAMDFLLEAFRKNRRRIRLEQLILLMLRCLAVFLIALMVMRPFMRSGALGSLGGLTGRTERILLLDDSFSTNYRSPHGGVGGQPVFARLKQAAVHLVQRISENSPSDSLTLVLTSRPRRPLVALPSLSEENVRALTDHLDELSPTQGVAHTPDALRTVAEQIRATPTQANQVIYVLSDFQQSDWAGSSGPGNNRPNDAWSSLIDQGRSVQLVLIDADGDQTPLNVAITDLRSAQSKIVAGVPARFDVAVSNFSDRALDRVEFSLRTSRHTLPPVLIPTLPPGQTVHEPVEVVFGQEGSDYLEARLVGGVQIADGVAIDNVRTTAVDVAPAVSVLVVNGESASDHGRDEVYLFCTALHPAGRAASGNELTIIEEQELEVADLSPQDVVVLANVARLSVGATKRLEQFVHHGGGLVIFAGDQVDPAFYNERLYNGGKGLLPVALTDVVTAPAAGQPFTFADWNSGHPLMRDFVDQLASVLRQVRVYAFLGARKEPVATSAPTKPSAGVPSKPDASTLIIARFNDTDKSPAVVERTFGQGRCLFVSTSVDQEWNDWPASFSYLPFMLKLVQYAARPALADRNTVVNATLACPIDPTKYSPRASLRTPAYPIEPEIALTASTATSRPDQPGADRNGILAFQTTDTSRSGLYQFRLHRTTGEELSILAAVNLDAAESNLAKMNRPELEAALGTSKFEYVRDIGAFTARAFDPRIELWWPILMAAILVLMLEHSLAWWFGTRG